MKESSIIPECNLDTVLIEVCIPPARRYNHQYGKGNVARDLMGRRKDEIALGIIDEDPGKGSLPKYFSEFQLVVSKDNLLLKKHLKRAHYLIFICPSIESWLLSSAKDAHIDIDKLFGFGSDHNLYLKKLLDISKPKKVYYDQRFRKLIKVLLGQSIPSILTLKAWLENFKSGKLENLK
ncbi:MAG TPA: hypothetical protein VE978_23310 [Chitinophagales bacterium]|nr:hypothetical protein [Chitinophagales bacterium]